jgi:hypothetical protein
VAAWLIRSHDTEARGVEEHGRSAVEAV